MITYEKVLRGFERVALEPGQTKEVTFTLAPEDLQLLNAGMQRVVEPGWFTVMVGDSSDNILLKGRFEIVN